MMLGFGVSQTPPRPGNSEINNVFKFYQRTINNSRLQWYTRKEGEKMTGDENYVFDTVDIFTKCKLITRISLNIQNFIK